MRLVLYVGVLKVRVGNFSKASSADNAKLNAECVRRYKRMKWRIGAAAARVHSVRIVQGKRERREEGGPCLGLGRQLLYFVVRAFVLSVLYSSV